MVAVVYNNSFQATAGAVTFELWPQPKMVKIQSGRHEGNNMSKCKVSNSAIMPARLRVPPCRVVQNPAAPEFGRYVAFANDEPSRSDNLIEVRQYVLSRATR